MLRLLNRAMLRELDFSTTSDRGGHAMKSNAAPLVPADERYAHFQVGVEESAPSRQD